MSDNICDKCGDCVRVPVGYEFNDGDLCWDCERAETVATITRLESRLAAAEKVIEAVRGHVYYQDDVSKRTSDMDLYEACNIYDAAKETA